MAMTIGTEYDHIDITNGVQTIRHPLKDASARENLVKVQDTQPESNDNVVWVKETPENEVQVPTYDEFSELKSAIHSTTAQQVTTYPKVSGHMGSNGTWNNINANYKIISVPVIPGDAISFSTGAATRYAFLKTYTEPVDGATIDYATGSSPSGVGPSGVNVTVPSDGYYLVVEVVDSGNEKAITKFVINDYNLLLPLPNNWATIKGNIQDAVNVFGVEYIGEYTETSGFINSSGNWNYTTSGNYKHIVIPINTAETVRINVDNNTYIAFVKSYSAPVADAHLDFSEQSGFTSRIEVFSSSVYETAIPSDAKYIIFITKNNGTVISALSFEFDGYNIVKRLYKNVGELAETSVTFDSAINGFSFFVNWENGAFSQTVGNPTTNSGSNIRKRFPAPMKFDYDVNIRTDGTYAVNVVLLDDSKNVVKGLEYQTVEQIVPKNTWFRCVVESYPNTDTNISAVTAETINEHVYFRANTYLNVAKPVVNWCAMGDSITEGYVSYLVGTTPHIKVLTEKSWAYKLAHRKNWNLTNIALGGTGWIDLQNSDTQGVTGAWYIARHTDFTPYNLVTLAYGINDWKGNIPLGTISDPGDATTPTTIYGGMKATIEAIMLSNPLCKIVVITPLNCSEYGDFAGDYGIGYSFPNNGTLEEVTQAIINVCNYYGIEYVDQTHYSCVNRLNIKDCLTDNVHPNAETHELICRELMGKITFE